MKVSLLNFAITFSGLEDQLLGVTVVEERPDMEEKKNSLVIANARMKNELQEIEDTILRMLANSTGNILDDVELIDTLATSKKTSEQINAKVYLMLTPTPTPRPHVDLHTYSHCHSHSHQVAEAETTEKEIDANRELYRPVAYHVAILYFCISDLAIVDPMYQFSLQWFVNLFVMGCKKAEEAEDLNQRLENLKVTLSHTHMPGLYTYTHTYTHTLWDSDEQQGYS